MDTPRTERYLAKAQECEQLAAWAGDRMVKYTFEELAQQWRDLAKQIRELTAGPNRTPLGVGTKPSGGPGLGDP
jgi:hypothetical protein